VGVNDSQTELAERTYFEDLKDPIEFRLPGINGPDAILHVGRLGVRVLSLVPNPSLNFCYSSATKGTVSETCTTSITGWAHVSNCSIAAHTDPLSSSNLLPFTPWLRALHVCAQISPSST